MSQYKVLLDLTKDLAEIIRPPRRISVADAVHGALRVSDGEAWDAAIAPYMIRPMNETASRYHDVVCFMGPARTGKTMALILGRWYYTVVCHPLDFMVVHSSQDLARRLSIKELARMHRYTPQLAERLTGRAKDDNTYDKIYKSGILGLLGWPSSNQLASQTIPVMLLTEYARWDADIGGDGSGFVQARKRTQTAGSLAMTVVESSPGGVCLESQEDAEQSYELGKPLNHAAPDVSPSVHATIEPIYNAGTREWWYVPCQACGEYYPQNAHIKRFSWSESDDPIIAADGAGTVCCWCGVVHGENTKRDENANGKWLADGEIIDCYGRISGESRKGRTYPSFWLGGGAAAYQTRQSIVLKYLDAKAEAEKTGNEKALKGVVNGDIGAPYKFLQVKSARAIFPITRRKETTQKRTVPEGVRFLVACVDVQADRFVCQVHGYGPDRNRWVIDFFTLKYASRKAQDGSSLLINPAVFAEDWGVLIPRVIKKTYPLSDGSGRSMAVPMTVCDLGGADGVTANAYNFWRNLKLPDYRLHERFRLIKGANSINAVTVEQRWPDTRKRTDIKRGSHGDVPILYVNTQVIKGVLDNDISRAEPGTGYCHFPAWLDEWWFKGLTKEQRNAKGLFQNRSGNEPWDLMTYGDAAAIWGPFAVRKDRPGGRDVIDWKNPPAWAAEWDKNTGVIHPDGSQQVKAAPHPAGRRIRSAGVRL